MSSIKTLGSDVIELARRIDGDATLADGSYQVISLTEVERALYHHREAKEALFTKSELEKLRGLVSVLKTAPGQALQLPRDVKIVASTQLATSSTPPLLRDDPRHASTVAGVLQLQDQGDKNACGPTALSMAMRYFQGATASNTVASMDTALRSTDPIDGFTPPRDLVAYAQAHGLRAAVSVKGEEDNEATSLGKITALLDQGVPAICLVDWDFEDWSTPLRRPSPKGDAPHYVVVYGYEERKDAVTGARSLTLHIADPNGYKWLVGGADFAKTWSYLGLTHVLVSCVPSDGDARISTPKGVVCAKEVRLPGSPDGDGFRGLAAQRVSHAMQRVAPALVPADRYLNGDPDVIFKARDEALAGNFEKRVATLTSWLAQGLKTREADAALTLLKAEPKETLAALVEKVGTAALTDAFTDSDKAATLLVLLCEADAACKEQFSRVTSTCANALFAKERFDALAAFVEHGITRQRRFIDAFPDAWIEKSVTRAASSMTAGAAVAPARQRWLVAVLSSVKSARASELVDLLGPDRLLRCVSDPHLRVALLVSAASAKSSPTTFNRLLQAVAHARPHPTLTALLSHRTVVRDSLMHRASAETLGVLLSCLSTGYTPTSVEDGMLALLRSTSWDQFRAWLLSADMPAQLAEIESDKARGLLLRWALTDAQKRGEWSGVEKLYEALGAQVPSLTQDALYTFSQNEVARWPAWVRKGLGRS